MEGLPSEQVAHKMTRRNFLGAAAAAGAVAAVPNTLTAASETYEAETSDSQWFDYEVHDRMEKYQRDLEFFVEKVSAVHADTEGLSVSRYVSEHFYIDGASEALQTYFRQYAVGMTFTESRGDVYRVSNQGAMGILQMMPEEWKRLADPDMNPVSVADAVAVSSRLASEKYHSLIRNCATELDLIRDAHFGGDQVLFDLQFMGPLVINAYHSGEGNMRAIVRHFAEHFTAPEATEFALDQSQIMSGRDVYYLAIHDAYNQAAASSYGEYSLGYVFEVYAAYRVFRNRLNQEQRETLLASL